MNFDEYQKRALETRIYPDRYKIIYPALKLAGEAGEVAGKVGKVLRDQDGEFTSQNEIDIALELGDILWYVTNTAWDIGYNLEEIAKLNNAKLSDRKDRGKLSGSGDYR